ncbi:MAG: LPS-assembly protein LptD [Bdellovibrionales bacterium]
MSLPSHRTLLFLVWLAMSAVYFASPAPVLAQSSTTDGVVINADSMFRDLEKRIVRLKGNVQVMFKGQHLSADTAVMDMKKEQITAEGNVILRNERVHVEGSRVVFNYKQNTGFIYNGFVQSGQVVFEGELIEKVGEVQYIATNGQYTACETCPPGWSFSGRKIDAEIGGYARITRPVFRIAGVPVLILPGLIVPLKTSRQSGFLVPSLDYSRKGGLALAESYFWAIDRSRDLTVTGTWYQRRGYKIHNDFRYVLSPTSAGRARGAWMNDRALQEEYKFQDNIDRWFIWYDHRLNLPENYVHRMEIKAVGDLRYPRDFPDELPGHGDPALTNSMSISRGTDEQYWSGEATVYTNLFKKSPLARNEDAVHRFPELRWSLKEQPLLGTGGPLFGVDVDYVNFARDKYAYDDLTFADKLLKPIGTTENGGVVRDGTFDPSTDIFRTGQRLDSRATLSYPFQIASRVDVLPIVSYRETQYRFSPTNSAEDAGFSPSAARRSVETDVRLKTEFSRIFGSTTDPTAERWKHSLEPEVGYAHIPWIRTPNHPFFGEFQGQQHSQTFKFISDTDVANPNTGLQFDYQDRTFEKQVVNLGLSNRLTRKTWQNGEPDYQTIALFRVSQAYDFNEARAPTPHPWSPIDSLLNLRLKRFETYTVASYDPYAKVTNLSSRIRLKSKSADFVEVGYTRSFNINEEHISLGETHRKVTFGAGLHLKYFDAAGQVDLNANNMEVPSWNYLLNIRPPGRCWLIRMEHRQIIGGDAQIRGSLAFDFGGNPT